MNHTMEDSAKTPIPERREFPRLKVDFAVIYQVNKPLYIRMLIGGKEVEAAALDFSKSGMAISTDYDIPVLAILDIKIMIYKVSASNNFNFYKTIKIQGEVRSNVKLSEDKFRIGVNFIQIGEKDFEELLSFINISKKSG